MPNWPTPLDLQERYDHAEKMLSAASQVHDSVAVQFYAGQLSVLGLFVEDDVLIPEKEIAVYSPNSRVHDTMKVINTGNPEEDIEYANKFADSYKEQAREGGIHADKDATVVYRYVTEWQKLEERNK
jgi:hypothetical protein